MPVRRLRIIPKLSPMQKRAVRTHREERTAKLLNAQRKALAEKKQKDKPARDYAAKELHVLREERDEHLRKSEKYLKESQSALRLLRQVQPLTARGRADFNESQRAALLLGTKSQRHWDQAQLARLDAKRFLKKTKRMLSER